MKALTLLTFACVLIISACTGPLQEQVSSQMYVAAAPMAPVYYYRCKSGETIAAVYSTPDTASVQYKGRDYRMKITVSASGARYVGNGLEWWTKGTGQGAEGTLLRHLDDGTSGEIIERCTETREQSDKP